MRRQVDVELAESVEPVEVRIVDVVVLPTACLTQVHSVCALGEGALLECKARIASQKCSKRKFGIDRDARRLLWVANFSTTRARSPVVVHWTS